MHRQQGLLSGCHWGKAAKINPDLCSFLFLFWSSCCEIHVLSSGGVFDGAEDAVRFLFCTPAVLFCCLLFLKFPGTFASLLQALPTLKCRDVPSYEHEEKCGFSLIYSNNFLLLQIKMYTGANNWEMQSFKGFPQSFSVNHSYCSFCTCLPTKFLEAKDLKQKITELNFWFVKDAVLCSICNMLSEPNFLKPDYAHVVSNVKFCQLHILWTTDPYRPQKQVKNL